jgi:hypothetical protein
MELKTTRNKESIMKTKQIPGILVAALVFVLTVSCGKEPSSVIEFEDGTIPGVTMAKSGLFLRDKPTTASEKLICMPYLAIVTVTDTNGPADVIDNANGKWYKVNYFGYDGWAWGKYIVTDISKLNINKCFYSPGQGCADIDMYFFNDNTFVLRFYSIPEGGPDFKKNFNPCKSDYFHGRYEIDGDLTSLIFKREFYPKSFFQDGEGKMYGTNVTKIDDYHFKIINFDQTIRVWGIRLTRVF